jgi:CubicO group peptidase (beta-lactamase class C family)
MYYVISKNNNYSSDDKTVPWWSFGKTVLATAVMKLVEQNRLELDKSYKNIPGTLKQLLRHEAGQPDYASSKAYHEAVAVNETPWDFDQLIEKSNRHELLFQPGEGWMYSNIGYYYIRKIIEETMSCSLQEALDELIFKPLSISDVTVAGEQSDLINCSHVKEDYQPRWLYHGMLIGSLESACTILDALSKGKLVSSESLLHMKEAYELHFDIGNRPWKRPAYALGLMMDLEDGSFGHTGMGPDSIVAVYHFPTEDMTLAVSKESVDQGEVEFEMIGLINEFKTR